MSNRQFGRAALTGAVFILGMLAATLTAPLSAQDKYDNAQRERARQMLRDLADGLRKHYFDPAFRGVDMEARFKAADEKIRNSTNLGAALTDIAGTLEPLSDSHTFFLPPSRPVRVQYGYLYEMIGDRCFVTGLRPGSDASAKLKVGDQILTLEGFTPTRDTLWKMDYFFNRLVPRGGLHLGLRADEVDRMIGRARKYQALILDLRGNPGGLVKTLERMVGGVMDHDVTIAKRVGRKPDLKPQLAKTRGANAFTGKLVVLVDSKSASAAELFARMVQLEHRGTVLGDRSSGSVMESRRYSFSQGADTKIFYGASITDADLIMSDGKSLEHNGVVPDELILPLPGDLAEGTDPVLARAAELVGVSLDAATAGKMFPLEWQPE
jgi:hypothetical protein